MEKQKRTKKSKNNTRNIRASDDDSLTQLFTSTRHPTLSSLDSFIFTTRQQGSVDIDNPSPIAGEDQRRSNSSYTRKSNFLGIPKIKADNDVSDTISLISRKTTTSRGFKRNKRRRNTNDKTDKRTSDVRNNHYYAGIGHSDLDVQTGRPPLLFQMNVVEWLWFQSDTQHRLLFMAVTVLFCTALIQMSFGIYLIFSGEFYDNPYICRTERCNDLSKRLLEKLNKSINPCNDFYSFVCGSSEIVKGLTEEEDTNWNYGFDAGRVIYDFGYSKTLGRMLRKQRSHPASLVLDMYQSCLDEKRRTRLGFDPYFKMLALFGLDKVSITASLKADDVVNSIANILSHSLISQAIMQVKFYRDDNASVHAYIEPALTDPIRAGPVYRYGYKRYYDTVYSTFLMLKKELHISDVELDVLPHDIICLELLFRDVYTYDAMKYVVDDVDNVGHKPCEAGDNFTGTDIKANFGQAPSGTFDFVQLVRKMYKIANPDWDLNSLKTPFGNPFHDPVADNRTDDEFIKRFENEFGRSAPIRFMRYLQWRLFYRVAFQLNDEAIKVMINVGRHHYLGKITNCFHALYSWMPFLAPNTFLTNSDKEIDAITQEFDYTSNQTIRLYYERAKFGIIKNLESELNLSPPLTDRQKKIIEKILTTHLRAESIPPVEYNDRQFSSFAGLFNNITFDRDHHLENILKMGLRQHEWKTKPELAKIFYAIKATYRVPVWFDKSKTFYNRIAHRFTIVLPMALAEPPFSNDGLRISDLGGVGFEIAGNIEKTFYSSLYLSLSRDYLHSQFNDPEFGKQPVDSLEIDEAEDYIINYYETIREKFQTQIAEYNVGGKNWDKIRYESAMEQILTQALFDQSRYHAMSLVATFHLQNLKTPVVERKSVLRGLEEYNLKQIFYIALVNRRCQRLGPKQYAQIYEHGPLPESIRHNLALSNLDNFAQTFKCPLGSPMNRKNKIYFWNRDFKIRYNHSHSFKAPL